MVVDGETLFVREVGALDFAKYGEINKLDRVKATGFLLSVCVLDGPGGNPLLTAEEAEPIAHSARVSMKLMGAIMDLSGFGEKEPPAS